MFRFYSQNIWNYAYANRNRLIWSLTHKYQADFCAFQECGPETNRAGDEPIQVLMSDVYAEASTENAHVNFTPVFYKKDKFNLVDCGYILYDGLNDCNSKSVTWALLEEKGSLKRVCVMSTHFWWQWETEKDNEQRLQNALQLKKICDDILSKYNVPIIIGGDFNNGINSLQGDRPYKFMLENGFNDIRAVGEKTPYRHTHHDYPTLNEQGIFAGGSVPDKTLDYIFTYGHAYIDINNFEVLTSQEALDSSDHCPLIGDFEI